MHAELINAAGSAQGWVIWGIAYLGAILTDHAEDLAAALLRYYQVDLADYLRGRLSARRLRVLVERLPGQATTVQARRSVGSAGPPGGRSAPGSIPPGSRWPGR